MKCKFCGKETKLIKAHIIPEGFFRRLKHQDNAVLEMLTNKEGEFPKRRPKGEYDKNLVCNDCEKIWQGWDDYAQQLLIDNASNLHLRHIDGKLIRYQFIENYDYTKLKLFFLSVLWRASASDQVFYSRIILGKLEENIKKRIKEVSPGTREDFSVVLSYFSHPLAKVISDPYMYKNDGVDYTRFYFANYIADIKVDLKETPLPLSKLSLAENIPLCIVCRNFENSKEFSINKNIVRHTERRKKH